MVGHRVVRGRRLALDAHGIAGRAEPLAVRIVAIAAGNARLLHSTLQPRTQDEHCILLLPVWTIELRRQRRRQVVVQKREAGSIVVRGLGTSRVALRAGLRLAIAGERGAAT